MADKEVAREPRWHPSSFSFLTVKIETVSSMGQGAFSLSLSKMHWVFFLKKTLLYALKAVYKSQTRNKPVYKYVTLQQIMLFYQTFMNLTAV